MSVHARLPSQTTGKPGYGLKREVSWVAILPSRPLLKLQEQAEPGFTQVGEWASEVRDPEMVRT